MKKMKVLFVCIHNSARSQMAEAFVNHLSKDHCEAQSAGLEPGTLNPFVVEAMREVGIDISRNRTKSVATFLDKNAIFDYVITVCDETSAEKCPVFSGPAKRLHWGFSDPSVLQGSEKDKRQKVCEIRDDIREKIRVWLEGFEKV